MVQTNTVHGPRRRSRRDAHQGYRQQPEGQDERGLAMALDGNGRWAYLDPKLGAMHAVAEAARKVACTGATPVAATNCLNFGNPEKPEIMAQLSAAIDGIAEACTALGTPITGGNVSLYNETKRRRHLSHSGAGNRRHSRRRDQGRARAFPASRRRRSASLAHPARREAGPQSDRAVRAAPHRMHWQVPIREIMPEDLVVVPRIRQPQLRQRPRRTSISVRLNSPRSFSVAYGASLRRSISKPKPICTPCCSALADRQPLRSARDISDGGIAVALAQASFPAFIGATVEQDQSLMVHPLFGLFAEPASTVSGHRCTRLNIAEIEELAAELQLHRCAHRHHRRPERSKSPSTASLSSPLHSPNSAAPGPTSLEATLHEEVSA